MEHVNILRMLKNVARCKLPQLFTVGRQAILRPRLTNDAYLKYVRRQACPVPAREAELQSGRQRAADGRFSAPVK